MSYVRNPAPPPQCGKGWFARDGEPGEGNRPLTHSPGRGFAEEFLTKVIAGTSRSEATRNPYAPDWPSVHCRDAMLADGSVYGFRVRAYGAPRNDRTKPKAGENSAVRPRRSAMRAGFRGIATCLIVLLLAVTLAACGKKNAPSAPPDEPNTYPRPYPSE